MPSPLLALSRLAGPLFGPRSFFFLLVLLPCVAATPGDFLIYEWGVVAATVITTLPWAVVSVWDAIDGVYRSRGTVALRLALASFCLLVAYITGVMYAVFVTIAIYNNENDKDRFDEVATILVLLIFNIWHVARNLRGWTQFFALSKLRVFFDHVEHHLFTILPEAADRDSTIDPPLSQRDHVHGLALLRISERLIDNDWRLATPFLNPFHRPTNAGLEPYEPRVREAWGVAMWRAWWTQDTRVNRAPPPNLIAPDDFRTDRDAIHCGVQDIHRFQPSALDADAPVLDSESGSRIRTAEQYAEALQTYGTSTDSRAETRENSDAEEPPPPGQQDTRGQSLPPVLHRHNPDSLLTLIHEKTHRTPNRMSALWYTTFRFETLYETVANQYRGSHAKSPVILPTFRSWRRLAHDITTHLDRPLPLSDSQLTLLAGELASTSALLTVYPRRYAALVDQIYADGLRARWTFGWSGLLACFSCLWTRDRVFVACLNGLSLLAVTSVDDERDLDRNVRAMLYGYAAFEVSDRAVGPRIARLRTRELLRRYTNDEGKTCRGTGVRATREACRTLGLPTEASHMDGLPAFSTGWLLEYLERLPGNQSAQYGDSHDDIETNHGSSNAWRYPHSHS